MLPQPATHIIVPPNVEILAFLASFRAILQYFGQFLPLWGHLGPFGASLALCLVGGKLPLVASSRVRSDLVVTGLAPLESV